MTTQDWGEVRTVLNMRITTELLVYNQSQMTVSESQIVGQAWDGANPFYTCFTFSCHKNKKD